MQAIRNLWYFLIGLFILFANAFRHRLTGYTRPRIFPLQEISRVIAYDREVVSKWIEFLKNRGQGSGSVRGKRVLELGPGPDLGTGLLLMGAGATGYVALDVNPLVQNTPLDFYDQLISATERDEQGVKIFNVDAMRKELVHFHTTGQWKQIRYLCRSDFDISVFSHQTFDMIVSQAAFEHFDDVPRVIQQLSQVARRGAIIVAEIDLQTHSRWIREKDPLNIYRYPDWLYRLGYFRGVPNRIRPYEYRALLEQYGWEHIETVPLRTLDQGDWAHPCRWLARKFQDPNVEMEYLSIMLFAVKR